MNKGIYGVNVAVKDLDEATARYEAAFGVKAERLAADDFAFPGLLGAKLNVNGFYVTLIASADADTSVAKFIERKGEGMFLLSVEVDRIELALSDETTELWRPDRSWIGPNDAIYTHVKDTSPRGSFEARFTRHAQTSLSSVLEADPKEECVWVVLGQTRTPLRPRHLAGDTSDATLLHSG